MQTLTLSRGPSTDQGTPGTILFNGVTFYTRELPWLGNAPDISCIPLGKYECIYGFSNHLDRYTYFIQGVPNRTATEIHEGNYAGLVSEKDSNGNQIYQSDVLGCILIGFSQGILLNKFGHNQECVLDSVVGLNKFEQMLSNETFVLSIQNAT